MRKQRLVHKYTTEQTYRQHQTNVSLLQEIMHLTFQPEEQESEGIKIGEIPGPMAPARGALSVRQYHRKDESIILPTKRLGMDLKEI
ncbi:Hypothetical predicted protein [Mytilus galloprovincialis]|uniref:Uncharacterized protein n=1 Tax=Mytilus galloprovincialis TaxID=29158 RepID=A0A8B6BV32_MYTGA|nr:Hypothetical predicted protein [Mytilus galloprovincialis]